MEQKRVLQIFYQKIKIVCKETTGMFSTIPNLEVFPDMHVFTTVMGTDDQYLVK